MYDMYDMCTRDKVSAFSRIDAAANDGRLVHRFKVFELGQIEFGQAAIGFDRLEQDRRFPAHVPRLALTQLPQHLYSLQPLSTSGHSTPAPIITSLPSFRCCCCCCCSSTSSSSSCFTPAERESVDSQIFGSGAPPQDHVADESSEAENIANFLGIVFGNRDQIE